MKLVLKENRTLPINETLFKRVFNEYFSLFFTIHQIMNNKKATTAYYETVASAGGKKFLDQMNKRGKTSVFKQISLPELIKVETDEILSRRLTQEKLDDLYSKLDVEQKTLSLGFYFTNSSLSDSKVSNSAGYCVFANEALDGSSTIFIGIPENRDFSKISNDVKITIRHEVQHFIQYHYGILLDIPTAIGLPTKKALNKISSVDTHSDHPLEMTTLVQDEIDWFVNDIKKQKKLTKKILQRAIFDYVGIGRKEYASDIFAYYFKTNKELWKWATNKLLNAVSTI